MTAPAQLPAYLARIGLDAQPSPDASGLLAVQAAHRQSIPFENLDVRLGRPIHTDGERVFDKLVTARRGGFCFEHNRLLADMLSTMGFHCRIVLARVLLGAPPQTTPRTHCLVLVDLDGTPWIADAGFGGAYAPPMPLADREEASSGDGARHRLRRIGEEGGVPGSWLLERLGPRGAGDGRAASDDQWEAQFAFDLAQVAEADLEIGCHWAATHPTSRFKNHTIVSLCLPTGFVSLVDRELTVWRKGQETVRDVFCDPSVFHDAISTRFGIVLEEGQITRLINSL